jgi:hypothetical protein
VGGAMNLSAKLGKIINRGHFTQTVHMESLKVNAKWVKTLNQGTSDGALLEIV